MKNRYRWKWWISGQVYSEVGLPLTRLLARNIWSVEELNMRLVCSFEYHINYFCHMLLLLGKINGSCKLLNKPSRDGSNIGQNRIHISLWWLPSDCFDHLYNGPMHFKSSYNNLSDQNQTSQAISLVNNQI